MKDTVTVGEIMELKGMIEKLEKAIRKCSPAERKFIKLHLDYYKSKMKQMVGYSNPVIIS